MSTHISSNNKHDGAKFRIGDVIVWREEKSTKKEEPVEIVKVDFIKRRYEVKFVSGKYSKMGLESYIPFVRENEFDITTPEKITVDFDPEEYRRIKAKLRTYNYLHGSDSICICPKCGEYMIIQGYVCFGCGYDRSHAEWEVRMKTDEETKQLNAENS